LSNCVSASTVALVAVCAAPATCSTAPLAVSFAGTWPRRLPASPAGWELGATGSRRWSGSCRLESARSVHALRPSLMMSPA
jgi:hypothetical protein